MVSEMKTIVKQLDLIADDLLFQMLRLRKLLLSRGFLARRIRSPPTTKYKRIVVTDQSWQWLEELEDVTELCISSLHNVSSKEEVTRVRLVERTHIETLRLEWHYTWDGKTRGHDDEVLEGLQPHPNLKKLIIGGHCGSKFPSWMENQWLSKLETVKLENCLTLLFTPLGLLPSLKYLYIVYPQLQSYGSQGCEGMEDSQLFPNLRALRISNFYHLERLPLLPPTLTELYIHRTNLTVLPGLWGCDGITPHSSLSSLHISHCCRINSLREGLLQHPLGALEILNIESCPCLESFPDDGLGSLVSLKSLTIINCHKLTWSPEHGSRLPSSLVDLEIVSSRGLCVDSFFMGMPNLTSLHSLRIVGPGEHYSLPGELLCHLTALTELEIESCSKLRMFGFQALASLRQLKISGCDNLHSPPFFQGWGPPPLEFLSIKRGNCRQFLTQELLQNLTSLKKLHITQSSPPEKGLESLTKLEELIIGGCRGCLSLQNIGLPPSLDILITRDCIEENYEEGGLEWPKFAHIPFVEIDGRQIQTAAWKQLILQGARRGVSAG